MQVTSALLDRVADATATQDPTARVDALLGVIREMSGLEIAFLTRFDHEGERLTVTHADHADDRPEGFDVAPGSVHAADATLCHRSVAEGTGWNTRVQETWGDLAVVRDLHIEAYVAVPVQVDDDAPVYGTLCAISPHDHVEDDDLLALMRLSARLIADAILAERDIAAARNRAARAQRFLRERLTFTAEVEHKMRTPLTLIKGWAEMLINNDAQLEPQQRVDATVVIRDNADRLLQQVEDLLSASRATMGVTALDPADVDLAAMAEGLEPILGDRTLVVHGGPTVHTDPVAARVMLEHLVQNAAAHTPEGTTVTVRVLPKPDGVALVVEDDGPGLPKDVDIFAAFQRGTDEGTGTGLGLHIVRTTASGLGGDVIADASDTGGARFTVAIPHRGDD